MRLKLSERMIERLIESLEFELDEKTNCFEILKKDYAELEEHRDRYQKAIAENIGLEDKIMELKSIVDKQGDKLSEQSDKIYSLLAGYEDLEADIESRDRTTEQQTKTIARLEEELKPYKAIEYASTEEPKRKGRKPRVTSVCGQ